MNLKKKAVFLSCAGLSVLAYSSPQMFAADPVAAGQATQAESQVHGTITDANGEPLIGATVLVKGTQKGTATDIDGNYVVKAKPGDILVVSYVGYVPSEVKVGNSPVLNIELQEMTTALTSLLWWATAHRKRNL